MFTLYTVPGANGARSLSPFAWKAEALLKLTGKPYQIEIVQDFSKMPNGKIPVLGDGEQLIADSQLIQHHLEKQHGLAIDSQLNAQQKAIAHAFRIMAEERLYWVGVYARMVDPAGENFVKQAILAMMPEDMQHAVMQQLRAKSQQQMDAHGIGRHSREQIYAFGCEDLQAISAYLGDKSFFFGDQITSIDCVLATGISGYLANDFQNPLTECVKQHANLVAYAQRFDQAVFG